jgi:hypothetical protein
MRFLLLLLAFGCALLARADGFAIGKPGYFRQVGETDQVAVIDFGPRQVDAHMFIAIDGIPSGETLTFILPFWHKPEGFAMEAMEGKEFREQYTTPLRPRIREARGRPKGASQAIFYSSGIGALVTCGPATPIVIFLSVLFPTLGGRGGLHSFQTVAIPAGSAELYRVETGEDLQELVRQAGLPEEYAKTLHKYETEYFAIMRLKGMAREADDKEFKAAASQGVHYSFRHAVNGESYTYTYPLGTGGAWPRPIQLTEVYLTCPNGYHLQVSAPVIGKDYEQATYQLEQNLRMVRASDDSWDLDDYANPATASLTPPLRYQTIWHRAYLMSNPTEDIVVQVAPRPFDPAYTLAMRITGPVLPAVISLLGLALSWLLAIRLVLRRYWIGAGQPETLAKYGWRFVGITLLVNGVGMAGLSLVAMPIIPSSESDLATIMFLGLSLASLIYMMGMWYHFSNRFDQSLLPGALSRTTITTLLFFVLYTVVVALPIAAWANRIITG